MYQYTILVVFLIYLQNVFGQNSGEYTLIQQFPLTLNEQWFHDNNWSSTTNPNSIKFTEKCGEFTVLGGPYDYEVSPNFRLHLENLPSHSHLKVEFKAWLIDGSTRQINFCLKNVEYTQQGYLLIKYLYRYSLQSQTPRQYVCGDTQIEDYIQDVETEYEHTSSSVILDFSGLQLNREPNTQYWGVSNFKLYYKCASRQIGNYCLNSTEFEQCNDQLQNLLDTQEQEGENYLRNLLRISSQEQGNELYRIMYHIEDMIKEDCFQLKVKYNGMERDEFQHFYTENNQTKVYFDVQQMDLVDQYGCSQIITDGKNITICENSIQVLYGNDNVELEYQFINQFTNSIDEDTILQVFDSYESLKFSQDVQSEINICQDISCQEYVSEVQSDQDLFIEHKIISANFEEVNVSGLQIRLTSRYVPEVSSQVNQLGRTVFQITADQVYEINDLVNIQVISMIQDSEDNTLYLKANRDVQYTYVQSSEEWVEESNDDGENKNDSIQNDGEQQTNSGMNDGEQQQSNSGNQDGEQQTNNDENDGEQQQQNSQENNNNQQNSEDGEQNSEDGEQNINNNSEQNGGNSSSNNNGEDDGENNNNSEQQNQDGDGEDNGDGEQKNKQDGEQTQQSNNSSQQDGEQQSQQNTEQKEEDGEQDGEQLKQNQQQNEQGEQQGPSLGGQDQNPEGNEDQEEETKNLDQVQVQNSRFRARRKQNFGDNLQEEDDGKQVLYICILVVGCVVILGVMAFIIHQALKIQKLRNSSRRNNRFRSTSSNSQIQPINNVNQMDQSSNISP